MKNVLKICICAVMVLTLGASFVACSSVPTGKAAYDTTVTGNGEDVKMSEVIK
jgi:hypothetical protein